MMAEAKVKRWGNSLALIIPKELAKVEDLSEGDKMRLLTAGVVTCKQLLDPANHNLVSNEFIKNVLPQLENICQSSAIYEACNFL